MKNLSQFINDNKQENIILDIIYIDVDLIPAGQTKGLIIEAKTFPIKGTKYWYRIDPPRGESGPGNRRHMHGFIRKKDNLKEIFAYNDDTTAHDGWHQTPIPVEYNSILTKSGFPIPKGNLIEMILVPADDRRLITESVNKRSHSTAELSSKELSNIIRLILEVIQTEEIFSLGVTNRPLDVVINDCKKKGFAHFNILEMTETRQKSEFLCELLHYAFVDITDNIRDPIIDINPGLKNAAYVFFVVY